MVSIEHYFKYHPPQTQERIERHEKINSMCLKLAKILDDPQYGDIEERKEVAYHQLGEIEEEISRLTKDPISVNWAQKGVRKMDSVLGELPQPILNRMWLGLPTQRSAFKSEDLLVLPSGDRLSLASRKSKSMEMSRKEIL